MTSYLATEPTFQKSGLTDAHMGHLIKTQFGLGTEGETFEQYCDRHKVDCALVLEEYRSQLTASSSWNAGDKEGEIQALRKAGLSAILQVDFSDEFMSEAKFIHSRAQPDNVLQSAFQEILEFKPKQFWIARAKSIIKTVEDKANVTNEDVEELQKEFRSLHSMPDDYVFRTEGGRTIIDSVWRHLFLVRSHLLREHLSSADIGVGESSIEQVAAFLCTATGVEASIRASFSAFASARTLHKFDLEWDIIADQARQTEMITALRLKADLSGSASVSA